MFNLKPIILTALFCLLFISSCDSSEKLISTNNESIIFSPTFKGETLTCNSVIAHSNKKWHYTQLQFFVSSIELQNNKLEWQKASLIKSVYQTDKIALLGEHCDSSNKKNNANWRLILDPKIDLTKITRIRFHLGLPFAINHLNPLTQESPLNISTMFWGWQKGHKFLRLEMASSNDNWLFHLGSIGCKAASPLRAPKEECRYPNRYVFELPIYDENNQITFDLSTLLSNMTITEQASCQSSPNKSSCQALFSNFRKKGELSVFQSSKKDIAYE